MHNCVVDWPDSVVVPEKLPSSLSLMVETSKYAALKFTVSIPELTASAKAASAEKGIAVLVRFSDQLYGKPSPVCPRMRAVATEFWLTNKEF